jgi:hypothetical protein
MERHREEPASQAAPLGCGDQPEVLKFYFRERTEVEFAKSKRVASSISKHVDAEQATREQCPEVHFRHLQSLIPAQGLTNAPI